MEVRPGSKYTLSIELLLYGFGQSNKFRKKNKKKFRDIQQITNIVPKTCFEGPLGDVLRTSWGRPESTSQGRPVDVRFGRPLDIISGRPQDVRLGRQIGTSPGCSNRIFRGRPGTLEGDVLGTSWEPISGGWVVKENIKVKLALALPAGIPIALVKEILLILPDVADKTIRVYQKQQGIYLVFYSLSFFFGILC